MALQRATAVPLPEDSTDTSPRRWAKAWDACQGCGTTEDKHLARGYCHFCYFHPNDRPLERKPAPTPIVAPPSTPKVDPVLAHSFARFDTPPPQPEPVPEPQSANLPAPTSPPAPHLRPRHAERVTIYRFACPNCGTRLQDPATGKVEYAAIADALTLACVSRDAGGTGCGAHWTITPETIAEAA